MDDKKKVTGKKSPVKVNPRSEEIMERRSFIAHYSLDTKLQEMRMQDDFDHFAVDYFTDEELVEICEEVLAEVDQDLLESLEEHLDMLSERMDPKEVQRRRDQAKDRLAIGGAMKRAAEKSSASKSDEKPSRGERIKSALKKAASTAKKVAVKAGRAAGEVAGAAAAGYRDAKGSSSSGSSSGSSSSSSSGSSSSSSGGGSSSGSSSSGGSNRVRLRDRLKNAIKKGVGKLARGVAKVGDKVATRMGESTVVSFGSFVTEAKDEEGFAGAATSYKGVVIRRTKSGYEAPRFNLKSNSVDSIKQNIDKEIAKVDEQVEFAGNYEGPLYAPHPDLAEAKKKCSKCGGEGCEHCSGKGYHAESAVPGKPAEKVGALTNIDIPQDERDAAKARLLAKAKAKREAMKKEEFEIEEGMTMKDFKANRRKLKRKEASDDAKKRGHVGKEWYNSGRTYSADEAKRGRANMQDHERQTRHRSAVDPDNDNDDMYSADKTKNPKKLRKQKAMGESLTFSQFVESCGCGSNTKKKTSSSKVASPMATEETINERGDFWHPDPEQDRKLGGPGANQRAREDRAAASKPKEDPKKLKKGESYMDYAKRHGHKPAPKEGLRDKIKRRLGLKNSFEPEGTLVDEARRGPAAPGKAEKGAAAAASLAAKRKRQEVLDKHEKKTGTKLDISKTPEGKVHAKNFPGSRQEKKVKGAKETPLETHNRRVNRQVDRVVKHGPTSKEKRENEAMAKHTSRYD